MTLLAWKKGTIPVGIRESLVGMPGFDDIEGMLHVFTKPQLIPALFVRNVSGHRLYEGDAVTWSVFGRRVRLKISDEQSKAGIILSQFVYHNDLCWMRLDETEAGTNASSGESVHR